MGKARDCKNRTRLVRKDDETRKKRVRDARRYIYEDHLSFAANFVEARLDDGSLVPTDVWWFAFCEINFAVLTLSTWTQNAFSSRLSEHGFDLFRMLVVDVMHEVELGVWKALFIQLLRLLEASKKGTMNDLDARSVARLNFIGYLSSIIILGIAVCRHLGGRPSADSLIM